MTAWQTALRRDSSTAQMVSPQPAPMNERILNPVRLQTPIAVAALIRSLVEQAVTACKWLRQKSAQRFATRRMRVSETVALGEKRFVTILDVDGTQLLIGSAAGQVSLLAILDEQQNAWRAGSSKEQTV